MELQQKGGWKKYKELTEEKDEKIETTANTDVDDLASKFEKKLTKIKHQAFGKISKIKVAINPKVANIIKERSKADDQVDKEEIDNKIGQLLVKEKYESVKRQVRNIKDNNATHQSQVFKLRNLIVNNVKND